MHIQTLLDPEILAERLEGCVGCFRVVEVNAVSRNLRFIT